MNSPSGSFSTFLLQNDAEEELTFGTPFEAIPFLSMELYEASRVSDDDPFSIINPDYMYISAPTLLDLKRNQFNSSQVRQKTQKDDDNCGTARLGSGSLGRSCDPSLPRAQRWKKRGANTENNTPKLIEKQRRNDMKTLYSKLMSLVPDENLKACFLVMHL
eukprot:Gb_26741 [translate_table: standard]